MNKLSEIYEEKEEAVDVECDCEEVACERAEPSEEEKLSRYEKCLQEDLERKLKRIEHKKKCDEIRKRFEAEHAEEYAKIKEYDSESFLEERVARDFININKKVNKKMNQKI